mmetsp:Transcript_4063/g.7488  ORF Transcript_4063/g.7488 Transcript_4063/m.7488 type:complete len:239 (+) Transcript_4063:935-1651(+)
MKLDGVDDVQRAGEGLQVGEIEHVGLQHEVARFGAQHASYGLHKLIRKRLWASVSLEGLVCVEDHSCHQTLSGIPLVESISVVGHEIGEVLVALLQFEAHRSGVASEDGQDWYLLNVLELQRLRFVRQLDESRRQDFFSVLLSNEAELHRHVEWKLLGLAWSRRTTLLESQRVCRLFRVIDPLGMQHWGSSLRIPALELREVAARRVSHCLAEVIASDRLAVVPLEIEIHALAEGLLA